MATQTDTQDTAPGKAEKPGFWQRMPPAMRPAFEGVLVVLCLGLSVWGATRQGEVVERDYQIEELRESLDTAKARADKEIERTNNHRELRRLEAERADKAELLVARLSEPNGMLFDLVRDPTSDAPKSARGLVVWHTGERRITVYAAGLEPLGAEREYHVWALESEQVLFVCGFDANADTTAVVECELPWRLAKVHGIGVTVESRINKATPQGPRTLVAVPRRVTVKPPK